MKNSIKNKVIVFAKTIGAAALVSGPTIAQSANTSCEKVQAQSNAQSNGMYSEKVKNLFDSINSQKTFEAMNDMSFER